MTRRDMFTSLAAGISAIAMAPAATPPRKFGRLTVDGWRAHKSQTGEHLHTYVNGVDVTWSCYESDDVEGYALVYCRDPEHHSYLVQSGALHIGSGSGVCAMRIEGDVVIKPGEPRA